MTETTLLSILRGNFILLGDTMKKKISHRHTQHSKNTIYMAINCVFLLAASIWILFPIQQNAISQEISFVITDINNQTHGAAGQRDYLFDDTSGSQVYTGTLSTNTTNTPTPSISTPITTTGGQTSQTGGWLYVGSLTPTKNTTGIQTAQQVKNTWAIQQGKLCTTPRGDTIKDKDFVLAYEQRKDVSNICNVQRRICNNGNLEGTYTQNSCQETIQYQYTRTQVISVNEPKVDPLVQPQPAVNNWANFSTNGKINETTPTTTTRWNTTAGHTNNSVGVTQTQNIKSDCRAPRGNIVKHGQFVKAYKSSLGLIDVPCETEIRLCVNGELKGKFLNKTCTVKNMTYNDYIAGNMDISKPTPQDIVDTLTAKNKPTTSFSINNRIQSLFK